MIIEVWDEDPKRAKEMTDYYVALVNEYNIELSTTEATRFREYIEAKYKDTMGKVDSLQAQTMAFQKKYGVIEFTAQATEYMSAISMTTALLMESEIKLKMIAENAKETNPLYQRQLKEVNHLKATLEEMYANTNPNDIILNFADMPEVSTQYVRLLAEAEILQEMLKYLVPIYENAKMEEVKAIPGLVVVDAPYLAEKKDKPKRMLIVVAATISGFLLMMIYFAIRELLRRNQAYLTTLRY
jgi:capsule polysaccharide export protein KpsE/RkpR